MMWDIRNVSQVTSVLLIWNSETMRFLERLFEELKWCLLRFLRCVHCVNIRLTVGFGFRSVLSCCYDENSTILSQSAAYWFAVRRMCC